MNDKILDEVKYNINPPWGKFYSKKLIEDYKIKFDEVFTANDVMFSTYSGHYANNIIIDLNYLYCSTFRKGSLEYSNSIEHYQPRFYIAISHYNFLLSKGKVRNRMNVWGYILLLRKLDKKWINYVLYCLREMKLIHVIHDLIKYTKNRIYSYFKSL